MVMLRVLRYIKPTRIEIAAIVHAICAATILYIYKGWGCW